MLRRPRDRRQRRNHWSWLFVKVYDGGEPGKDVDQVWGEVTTESAALAGVALQGTPVPYGAITITSGNLQVTSHTTQRQSMVEGPGIRPFHLFEAWQAVLPVCSPRKAAAFAADGHKKHLERRLAVGRGGLPDMVAPRRRGSVD